MARCDSERQRAGDDFPTLPSLVYRETHRRGSHPAGKANAERSRGKFPWPASGRMFERGLVLESVRRTEQDRGLACRLQLPEAAFGYEWPPGAFGHALWPTFGHLIWPTSESVAKRNEQSGREGRTAAGAVGMTPQLAPEPATPTRVRMEAGRFGET